MKAAILMVFLTGCSDESSVETFVTVSRDRMLVLDVNTACACDVHVLAPGDCGSYTDVGGRGCACSANTPSAFVEITRDGSVVAAGSGQLAGDFSGASVVVRGRGIETTFEVPAQFPPTPAIVTADASGVTWSVSPPHEVVVSIGSLFTGEYCREPREQTHVDIGFSPSSQSLVVTSEVTTDVAPTVHVTMTASAAAGQPF
jgi:hypothetical protein